MILSSKNCWSCRRSEKASPRKFNSLLKWSTRRFKKGEKVLLLNYSSNNRFSPFFPFRLSFLRKSGKQDRMKFDFEWNVWKAKRNLRLRLSSLSVNRPGWLKTPSAAFCVASIQTQLQRKREKVEIKGEKVPYLSNTASLALEGPFRLQH